jgi:hypothetical protein
MPISIANVTGWIPAHGQAFKGEFAVVPTVKFVGRAYHQKSLLMMSHDQLDLKVTYLGTLILEVIFVVFRLMKNIIFNKIESFVGRNTIDHACQIFCSKSNYETVSLIFPPRDNCG